MECEKKAFEEIKQFILRERWHYDFEITSETSLQDDLKIFGDDASEILTKFCIEFNVDYSDFKFDDYFHPEVSWNDFFVKKKKYKKLTIGHLVKAVQAGRLDEEIINSK